MNRSGDLQVARESEGPAPRPGTRFERKANRLPAPYYEGGIYFVTLNCDGKSPYLRKPDAVKWCEEQLASRALRVGAALLAYTIMPDHLHVLVAHYQGSLSSFMKGFKQLTGFHFKRETGLQLWQKGYYDHIVRREEDLADIALYIAANPVRRGLVADWEEYSFTGGSLLARSEAPHAARGDLKVAATLGDRSRFL